MRVTDSKQTQNSVSAQRSYSPARGDDPSQTEKGKRSRTPSHSDMYPWSHFHNGGSKPCQSYREDGSALLPYRPIRAIRLICGAFQPCVIFRPVFFHTLSIISGDERSFSNLFTPFLYHACSNLHAAPSRDRLIWMNIMYRWEPHSLIGSRQNHPCHMISTFGLTSTPIDHISGERVLEEHHTWM